MKKSKKIDREETIKLITEKNPEITLESINGHSDYYWEDVCNNLDITPVYKTQIIPDEN